MNKSQPKKFPLYMVGSGQNKKLEQRQFKDFSIVFDSIEPLGFSHAIKKHIRSAIDSCKDFVFISTNEHQFSDSFNRSSLIYNLDKAKEYNCDIICGGFGKFGVAVPISDSLLWIDHYLSCYFIVIYKSLYERILQYGHLTSIDSLSSLTANKMVVYPFISTCKFTQTEFSDLNAQVKKSVSDSFIRSENSLALYLSAHKRFNNG